MGSLGNPKPWVPYVNTNGVPYVNSNDCSQGFCSLYCPQWCYIIFPPPPPLELSIGSSGPNFSPLVIAIIGILASAFLLVSYYAIISKYCGRMDSSGRREQNRDPNEGLEDSNSNNNEDPSTTNHEPWIVASAGLDEALIKLITVCKYKKGDGLIEGTECSVCLSEFQDDERLRLLPKCNHAFHVTCIDTWLKSHSNCPLCRANIAFVSASPVVEAPPVVESSSEIHENVPVVEVDIEMGVGQEEEILQSDGFPKRGHGLSGSGSLEARDAIIEIREEEEEDRTIRRSVSMDNVCQGRIFSMADALRLNQDEFFQAEECQGGVGSSKQPAIEMMISKCSHRSRVLHCVMSPVVMKRSFSSGRFSFSRRGRGA